MSNGYLKCNCEHCEGPIEYPVESAGEVVRCPHCQLPTPLTVPGGDVVDDGLVVGGKMGKVVVAGLAILLIVVIGAAGTVVYLNQLKKKKGGAPASAAAPAAPGNPGASAPAGDWQTVRPVVGKFQGGLTAAQIREGRYVLGGACTECHKMYDPVTYSRGEWDNVARNMRGKAKLRGHEFEDLQVFVRSIMK